MSDQPRIECEVCRKPVTGMAGYFWIDQSRAYRAMEEMAAWEAAHQGFIRGDDFMAMPETPSWHIHPRACDTEPVSGAYWFEVARADTWPKIAGWVAHLVTKNWVSGLAISGLLRSLGAEDA